MKKFIWFGIVSLAFVSSTAVAASPSKGSAAKAIAAAAARIKIAESMNDQWLATLAAFKAAKVAQVKGNFAVAQSKAVTALTLANLSIKQASAQKTLWVNEVVK